MERNLLLESLRKKWMEKEELLHSRIIYFELFESIIKLEDHLT